MTVGHCVCFVNCELGCEMGVNIGLTPIVIVIVIGCHILPLFFLKSGTLIFDFFGIIITDDCLHSAFALPSLWLRSRSGGKAYSKWDEKAFDITYPFVG